MTKRPAGRASTQPNSPRTTNDALQPNREVINPITGVNTKPPTEITSDEIDAARADLRTLAKCLRRDVTLSWWR